MYQSKPKKEISKQYTDAEASSELKGNCPKKRIGEKGGLATEMVALSREKKNTSAPRLITNRFEEGRRLQKKAQVVAQSAIRSLQSAGVSPQTGDRNKPGGEKTNHKPKGRRSYALIKKGEYLKIDRAAFIVAVEGPGPGLVLKMPWFRG